MLQYVFAGLALGSIYAIASAALVVTFVSSGVLNFAFGSMAYVVARFYYWLNSQHHMSTISAGLLSILVLAPLLGTATGIAGDVRVDPHPMKDPPQHRLHDAHRLHPARWNGL